MNTRRVSEIRYNINFNNNNVCFSPETFSVLTERSERRWGLRCASRFSRDDVEADLRNYSRLDI